VVEVEIVDMLVWGPALDAELEYRRERLARRWSRPARVDDMGSPARHRVSRRMRVHPHAAPDRAGGVGEPGSVALR
jgi:hypothetical protein